MFRIDKVLVGPKKFKEKGVGIMTNAVCASVLFHSTPVPPVPDEEDESLLQSIQQLSLTPHDDDDDDDDEDDDDNGNGEEIEDKSDGDNSNVSYIHDGMLMILCMLSI